MFTNKVIMRIKYNNLSKVTQQTNDWDSNPDTMA